MPKQKAERRSDNRHTNSHVQVSTDVHKSLSENLSIRLSHWEQTEKNIKKKLLDIQHLEEKFAAVPTDSRNRSIRADLRILIEEEKQKLKSLSPENEMVDYMACLAKVIWESEQKTDPDQDVANTEPKLEEVRPQYEERMVSTLGPIRPRMKKKRLVHNVPPGKTTMVTSKSIMNYINVQQDTQNGVKECTRLAQLMHEIPVDVDDKKYCPRCPNKVVMEFIEKPPSMYCPMCSISRDTLDVNSAAVHDKETQVHIPFTYRPKQHFLQWIKRITGELKYPIMIDVLEVIYIELYNRRIYDVNDVTWDLVDRILRKLANKVDKKYNQYYQHVYQITNIIRGAAILILSESQKQTLSDMFDIIYECWERNKSEERSNFMSNAYVLQLCFRVLGYPEKVVNMFNMLKGPDNQKEYDRITRILCQENPGWERAMNYTTPDNSNKERRNILDMMRAPSAAPSRHSTNSIVKQSPITPCLTSIAKLKTQKAESICLQG